MTLDSQLIYEAYNSTKVDPKWSKWLKKQKHTVNADGSVDIEGNVGLNNQNLKKLPFKFGKVGGDFNCFNNQLTTLEGSPHTVGGYFNCSRNQIPKEEEQRYRQFLALPEGAKKTLKKLGREDQDLGIGLAGI